LHHLACRFFGLDDGELAVLDAGARDDVAMELLGLRLELESAQAVDHLAHLRFLDVKNENLLEWGEANAVGASSLGNVGDLLEFATGYSSSDRSHTHVVLAVALLVDAHVVAA